MKISELPEPYKTLAEKRRREDDEPNTEIDDLIAAFEWSHTPEGIDFWDAVDNALSEKELPPIPVATPTKGLLCELLQRISDEHDGQVNLDSRIMQEMIADQILKEMEEHNGNLR